MFVWAYTNDGKYTVKSGNWLLNHESGKLEVATDDIRALNKIKEHVWSISTAPKIKMFLWRALSGALAVTDCLRRHGLNINRVCQVCNSADETISHVLFGCPMAKDVWVATSLPISAPDFASSVSTSIDYLFRLMKRSDLPIHLLQAIPWFLWEIWKARNTKIYANKVSDSHIIVAKAIEEANEWMVLNALRDQENLPTMVRPHSLMTKWSKQALGCLKCNIHTSWVKDTFHCGGAWILRNHVGDVVFHARDAFLPMVNRIAVELHCIHWCLQSLHDLRVVSCEIWSDCQAALRAIESPLERPKYRSQLSRIQQALRQMRDVKFRVSSPKANSLAKDIACSVTRDGRLASYLARGGPAWLHNRILEESR